MTTETLADPVDAEVIVMPLTDDEVWGEPQLEPDPHASDPDEDKENDE